VGPFAVFVAVILSHSAHLKVCFFDLRLPEAESKPNQEDEKETDIAKVVIVTRFEKVRPP
jgi:hypothetical protein